MLVFEVLLVDLGVTPHPTPFSLCFWRRLLGFRRCLGSVRERLAGNVTATLTFIPMDWLKLEKEGAVLKRAQHG